MSDAAHNAPARIHMLAWFLGALAGVVITTLLTVFTPTESDRVVEFLHAHRDEPKQLQKTLKELAIQARAVPIGTIATAVTQEQQTKLTNAIFDFRDPEYDQTWLPNAAVALLDDFPAVPDPDSYETGRSVLLPKTFGMNGLGDEATLVGSIDEMRRGGYGGRHVLEKFYARMNHLQFIVLIRMGKRLKPVVQGESFQPGYQQAEAFFFDVKQKRLLGGFSFAATNRSEISYQSRFDNNLGSALLALGKQLDTNLETEFWVRLHTLIPGALSGNQDRKIPYTREDLQQAEALLR